MKPLALDALKDYTFLSRPTFSPSGKTAVFVAKKANMKDNGYDSCLYMVRFPECGKSAAAGTPKSAARRSALPPWQ